MNNFTRNSIIVFIFAIIIFVIGTILYWWSNSLTGLASACIIIGIILFLVSILILGLSYDPKLG